MCDPICSKPGPKVGNHKEFGTITEFFFLALQFLHVGVCGAMDSFTALNEMKKNLEKEIEARVSRLHPTHPMKKKAQIELSKLQSKIVRYWILLNDEALIMQTVQLLQLLLDLLPKWMGVDYHRLKKARLEDKPSPLIHFLPEMLLSLVNKYHSTMVKIKENYLMLVREQHIRQVIELSCFLLSEQEVVTNPYLSAEFVELIFLWLHDPKSGIIHEQLRQS